MFIFHFHRACLRAATIIRTQPVKNRTPPIGVMAPKTLIPLIASTYKLPEKKIIPRLKRFQLNLTALLHLVVSISSICQPLV